MRKYSVLLYFSVIVYHLLLSLSVNKLLQNKYIHHMALLLIITYLIDGVLLYHVSGMLHEDLCASVADIVFLVVQSLVLIDG